MVRKGGISPNKNTSPMPEFDTIYKTLVLQGKYIEAIHKMSEMYNIDWEA